MAGKRIDLSTAGIGLGYAVETTAGTKPSEFTKIPGAKSLPEVNPEPETMETTTLDEIDFKTYIDGLKDVGGSLAIGFNMTKQLETLWPTIVEANETAKSAGKSTWFEFYVPGLTNGFFFRGNPAPLGFGGAEPNGVFEISAYVTPVGDIGWSKAIAITDAV